MKPTKPQTQRTRHERNVPPSDSLAYTVDEAADRLRISKRTMFRLIAAGKITPSKILRSIRVSREELERYLRQTRVA